MFLLLLFLFFIKDVKIITFQFVLESIVKAYVLSGLVVFFNIEITSFFNQLNHTTILLLYLIELGIVVAMILKYKINIFYNITFILQKIKKPYLLLMGFPFIILLFLSIYIPTNNNDSISYHLPRVFYWMQNGNVNFYPTLNGRQLFLNPFAEYLILQNKLLTSVEYFNNLPQFVAMIISVITVYLITLQFSNNKKTALLSSIFCFCLPMGIFQSTSTQNDYVTASYTIIAFYFLLKIYQNSTIKFNYIYFGVALFLCGFTKYTGWIVLFPFLLFYGIKIILKNRDFVLRFIAIGGFVLLFSLPQLLRNYQTFQNFTGPKPSAELYVPFIAVNFGIKDMASNFTKNIAVSASVPFQPINKIVYKTVLKFNKVLGININKEWNNYNNIPFTNNFVFYEDGVSNFIHFLLFLFSLIFLFFVRNKNLRIYALLLLSSYILFSALLMWQPWHNRLEMPWFVLLCPYLAMFIFNHRILKFAIIILMIIFVLPCLFLNPSKSIITLTKNVQYPSLFSLQDLKEIKQVDALLYNEAIVKLIKTDFHGIIFYKTEDTILKKQLSRSMNFNYPNSIFKKNYFERMFPFDMTVCRLLKNLNTKIQSSNSNVAVSILAGTPEYAVLYSLEQNKNVKQVQNIGVLNTLKNLSNSKKKFEYDYLITNNPILENQLNSNDIGAMYDYAYFKLYHFKTKQHKKYLVEDVLQEAYNK